MSDMGKIGDRVSGILLAVGLAAGISMLWSGNFSNVAQSSETRIVDAEPVIYLDGRDQISVEGEGIQSVSYSSSAKKVAKIDQKGKITPLRKGRAVIRAKVSYRRDGKSVKSTLSYPLQVLGKSTEYFKFGQETAHDTVQEVLVGLTAKGKKLREVYIPGYHGKWEVACVDGAVFQNDQVVEKIYAPDNLLYLGYFYSDGDYGRDGNFTGCTNLKELHLGKNLKGIDYRSDNNVLEKIVLDGRNAFFRMRDNVLFSKKHTLVLYPGARKDATYQIPEGIKEVEWHAFSGAKHLKHIIFPAGIEVITHAFIYSGLTEVTIPESVKDYDGAFLSCTELEKAVIASKGNEKWPEDSAFQDCTKLKTVIISGKMDGGNFSGCRSLERFTLSPEVKDIMEKDDVLFSRDGKVLLMYPAGRKNRSYTLPAGTQKIAGSAFAGVQHLEEAVMNPELISIGNSAFFNGTLAKVVLNQGMEKIGMDAFAGTPLVHVSLPDSVKSIDMGVFADCKKLQSVKLSANIEKIPAHAVIRCTSLKTLHIPGKVKKIECGDSPFAKGCKSLTAFTADRNNQHFTAVDGVLYSKSKKTLYAYPMGKKGEKFVIPKSVKKVAGYAFADQPYLQKLSMNHVAALGNCVFEHSALRKISFSKNLKSLPLFAFHHCKKLKKVVIPDYVRSVYPGAFQGCTSLKSVVVGKRADLGESVFEDCRNLKKVVYRRKVKKTHDVNDLVSNETFRNTGSRHYRKLVMKMPNCSKKYRKMLKGRLYGMGCLSKKAKVVFGKQ